VACRHLRHGIDDVLAGAGPDREDSAKAVARAYEDVIRPGRAVNEVPGLQRALLAFYEQQALALKDEEVFLRALAVVETGRLAGLEDPDVDPELLELGLALENRSRAELLVLEPACVLRVDDEPAAAFRDKAAALRLLQACFRNYLDLRFVGTPRATNVPRGPR
jgi:hypothetical protein